MVKLPDDIKQQAQFTRTGKKDAVTGTVTYGDWQPPKATLAEVEVPTITGYTPNVTSVPAVDVTGDSKDINTSVAYTANGSKIVINFVDNDLSNHVVLTKTITGKFGKTCDYDPSADTTTLINQGYQVSSSNYPTTKPTFTDDIQTFTINLVHAIIDVTPDDPQGVTDLTRTVTRTISFSESVD